MELIILKNHFKNGLDAISKIGAEGSTTLPILKNFLIETVDNKIKLSTTNLEMAILSFVPAKIIKEGSLTIPFNIINSIINNLQSERIILESKNDNLIIKTDNYQAKIQGTKHEEFPIIPNIGNKVFSLKIPTLIIKDALFSIINAAQFSEIKQELNGILFDFQLSFLKLAATDSFRLSEKTIINNKFKTDFEDKFKAVIPIKTIHEVVRIFKNEENEEIEIIFDQNQVLFEGKNTKLISRLINEEFPDYQSIIPQISETEAVLSKEQLIQSLKLTGSFTDRLNEIKIIIKKDAKNIEIYSNNSSLGENQYLIPAKIKGPPIEIIFNWKFLLDGLKVINSENIYIGMNSNNRPAIIKSPNEISYFYILMPVKSS